MAKAKPELLDAKKVIEKCDVCEATEQRRSTPPSRLSTPRSFELKEVIGIDLLVVDTILDGQDKPENETTLCHNILDRGAGRPAVVRLPDRESQPIRRAYRQFGLRLYERLN